MKIFKTIAWATLLILGMIIAFIIFCRFNQMALMHFNQKQYDLALQYTFSVKGYILTNLTLIGAYIVKLIEIWGKEDE